MLNNINGNVIISLNSDVTMFDVRFILADDR